MDLDNNSKKNVTINQAYETQFYGFTPSSLIDGFYNAFSSCITEGFQDLDKTFNAKIHTDIKNVSMILEDEDVNNEIRQIINHKIDKLEVYGLQNVIQIPLNIILPEDKLHSQNSATSEDVKKERQIIENLELKLKMNMLLASLYMEEINEIQSTLQCFNNSIEFYKQFENNIMKHHNTSVQFDVMDKLQNFQNILQMDFEIQKNAGDKNCYFDKEINSVSYNSNNDNSN